MYFYIDSMYFFECVLICVSVLLGYQIGWRGLGDWEIHIEKCALRVWLEMLNVMSISVNLSTFHRSGMPNNDKERFIKCCIDMKTAFLRLNVHSSSSN